MEYRKVELVTLFNVTDMGLPAGSNTSTRPLMTLGVRLSSMSWLAHPPPTANCGNIAAAVPPIEPLRTGIGDGPEVLSIAITLKFVPANRKPMRAEIGRASCRERV